MGYREAQWRHSAHACDALRALTLPAPIFTALTTPPSSHPPCAHTLQISGSCETSEVGKGAFQECDQVAAVKQFCK